MSAPIRPGNQERGWNDPPFFDYNTVSSSQASPRRAQLNKRVGHALNPGSQDQSPVITPGQSDSSRLPPPMMFIPTSPNREVTTNTETSSAPQLFNPAQATGAETSPTSQLFIPGEATNIGTPSVPQVFSPGANSGDKPEQSSDSDESRTSYSVHDVCRLHKLNTDDEKIYFAVTELQNAISECQHYTEARVMDDMKKKCDVFAASWRHGKLSTEVKDSMIIMTAALIDGDYSRCTKIHVSLMVDFTSEVKDWLIGVKKIVETLKQKSPLPEDNVEASVPSCDDKDIIQDGSVESQNCADADEKS